MKHTDGEWIYNGDGLIYSEHGGDIAALKNYSQRENREVEANAHLISAAPEMYEALKQAEKVLSDGTELAIIRAALQRAERGGR